MENNEIKNWTTLWNEAQTNGVFKEDEEDDFEERLKYMLEMELLTYRNKVAKAVFPKLIESNRGDIEDTQHMTPEQAFLHRRLWDIRNILEKVGIPISNYINSY